VIDRKATKKRVLVIPCSGIGKVHGLLSREATYLVVDELAPEETDTLCLALLVKGDPAALEEVQTHKCITIDGCGKACAQKNVEVAGGQVGKAIEVASVLRDYRGAQPGTGSVLTDDGWAIARDIATLVAAEVACVRDGEEGDR
jgi:uncharacterized metal-binding protein